MMLTLVIILSACQATPRQSAFVDLGGIAPDPVPDPDPVEIVRPDGAVFFKNDFCACNNTKPVIISGSSCANFCATKNTNSTDTLYFNFTVVDVIITDGYDDTYGWCTKTISESDNPSCVLEVKSISVQRLRSNRLSLSR